jgi:hypothetical protein
VCKGAVDNTAAPIARDSAVREGRVAIKSVNHAAGVILT